MAGKPCPGKQFFGNLSCEGQGLPPASAAVVQGRDSWSSSCPALCSKLVQPHQVAQPSPAKVSVSVRTQNPQPLWAARFTALTWKIISQPFNFLYIFEPSFTYLSSGRGSPSACVALLPHPLNFPHVKWSILVHGRGCAPTRSRSAGCSRRHFQL